MNSNKIFLKNAGIAKRVETVKYWNNIQQKDKIGKEKGFRDAALAQLYVALVCVWSIGNGSFFVLRPFNSEEIFEFPLQCFEGRSLHGVFVPCLQHDFVEGRWAVRRCRHSIAMLHLMQHLRIGHAFMSSIIIKKKKLVNSSYL